MLKFTRQFSQNVSSFSIILQNLQYEKKKMFKGHIQKCVQWVVTVLVNGLESESKIFYLSEAAIRGVL